MTPPATTPGSGTVFSATVGEAFTADLTRGGTLLADRLTPPVDYLITAPSDANGLAVAAGTITGTPKRPGVVPFEVLGSDKQGHTARTIIRIAAFSPGLPTPRLPSQLFPYSDERVPLPRHLTVIPGVPDADTSAEARSFATNLTTDAGATLGRVLFHDRRLSANDAISCESCHLQAIGFADTARFSHGFAGGLTRRHSMAIQNLRFRGGVGNGFFWDGRAATLETQVLAPIQDPIEMGSTLENVVAKVQAAGYYQPLFAAAFGTTSITEERIARALAQYLRAIVSRDSKFDRVFGDAFAPDLSALSPEERRGQQVFTTAGCSACHFNAIQMTSKAVNSGLDERSADVGAGEGRFRAPSLRNVALRAPYMHDGRFSTLEQVIDFYNDRVADNAALDPRLRQNAVGPPKRLGLSLGDRTALVAFLKALTDSVLIKDVRFSDPFTGAQP